MACIKDFPIRTSERGWAPQPQQLPHMTQLGKILIRCHSLARRSSFSSHVHAFI